MKILYVTSYLSFHTYYLFEELIKLGNDVLCIESSSVDSQRLTVGDNEFDCQITRISIEDFLQNRNAYSFDIVIISSFSNKQFLKKFSKYPFVFFMTEHFLKKITLRRIISYIYMMLFLKINFKKKNAYVLCNSQYTAKEFSLFGFSKTQIFNFGYFPKIDFCFEQDKKCQLQREKKLLWIGRMINWKHPEIALYILKFALNYDSGYKLVMIGDGPEKNKLISMAKKLNCSDKVTFLPFMKNKKLPKYFLSADLYLFTSNREEGWGAVLNEAMGYGCIVIANSQAGSTPLLISNQVNGYIYKSKKEIRKCLSHYFALSSEIKQLMRSEAIDTIKKCWNYKNAANRLNELFLTVTSHKRFNPINKSGPISSPFIKDGFKKV